GRHIPSSTDMGIIDLCLDLSSIVMVAQCDVPIHVQAEICINSFKRRYPMKVCCACNAVRIKIVSHRDDKLRIKGDSRVSQFPRNVLLVIVADTPKVTQYQKAVAIFDVS